MSKSIVRKIRMIAVLGLAFSVLPALAGKRQKWDDLPPAVRKTILANGGTAGQDVDKENGKREGKNIYEASIKGQNGTVSDLVVLEDGKLAEIKTDDAADKAAEEAGNKKTGSGATVDVAGLRFSHPRDINNAYLPLGILQQDILEGKEGTKNIRIERTVKPDRHKTFQIGGHTVESLVVEDKEYEDGQVAEVAIDYFAQDDQGTVYYLGEDVDEYDKGNITGHEGSWMLGKDTPTPGILFPDNPKVGQRFKSEDVNKDIHEEDEIISLTETVKTPAGTYRNCVKVKESLADGTVEFKYYAKGIGVVREQPGAGDVLLKSHSTSKQR